MSDPDFSPRSKTLIARTVRRVLGTPADGNDTTRDDSGVTFLETALLKITSNPHRGYYLVDVIAPKAGDVVTTADISASDLATAARASGYILMNPQEINGVTPFAVGDYVVGRRWYVNSDHKTVFLAAGEYIPHPRAKWHPVQPINSNGDLACARPTWTTTP